MSTNFPKFITIWKALSLLNFPHDPCSLSVISVPNIVLPISIMSEIIRVWKKTKDLPKNTHNFSHQLYFNSGTTWTNVQLAKKSLSIFKSAVWHCCFLYSCGSTLCLWWKHALRTKTLLILGLNMLPLLGQNINVCLGKILTMVFHQRNEQSAHQEIYKIFCDHR